MDFCYSQLQSTALPTELSKVLQHKALDSDNPNVTRRTLLTFIGLALYALPC